MMSRQDDSIPDIDLLGALRRSTTIVPQRRCSSARGALYAVSGGIWIPWSQTLLRVIESSVWQLNSS